MKSIWFKITIITAGLAGGYLYYYFVGCQSGTCPITSNPISSMMYGGAIGFFISMLGSSAKNKKRESDNNANL